MRLVFSIVCLLSCLYADAQIITTIAGIGTAGFIGDGGPATAAYMYLPIDVKLDDNGNMYIADYRNYRIRKVDPAGIISTIAGNGGGGSSGDGGPATAAQIGVQQAIAVDRWFNVYALTGNVIRKITPAGIIDRIAGGGASLGDGGPAIAAQLNTPGGMAVDTAGNIYIADTDHSRVRKINPAGIINTIAGDGSMGFSGDGGPGTAAKLGKPVGVVVDSIGNVYILDALFRNIRKLSPGGIITAFAGSVSGGGGFGGDGGPASAALFYYPRSIAIDREGNLYIGDFSNQRIRKIDTAGIINTIAGMGASGYSGDGYDATAAQIANPRGLAVDSSGNVYISDFSNHRIRMVTCTPPVVPAIAGPDSICEGTTATMTDSTTGGIWSSSDIAVCTINAVTGVMTGIVLGVVTIVYSKTTPCATTVASKVITVNPLPHAGVISGPATVCAGSPITLTDTATGGIWVATNATASVSGAGVVTEITPGTDTIMYIVANGCGADTAMHSITVGNVVATIILSGAATFCAGSSVTLTADTGTGYTWQWYNGSTAISGATNYLYTASTTGNYKVAITNSSGCSGTSAITTLTVNPLPTTSISAAGATTFCTGGSVALNAAATAGYSYQWSNAGVSISGATNSSYTATTNGSYIVGIVNGVTGCADSTPTAIVVTVNPLPYATATASGPVLFCPGGSVVLAGATGAGYTWQWYSGSSVISGGTNAAYTATTAGNYTTRITNSSGCSDTSAVITVGVYSLPTATITPSGSVSICYGDTATLSASIAAGYTYQWYNGSTPISGATNATYRTTVLGNYKVRVTNSTGCTNTSAVTTVIYGGPPAVITGPSSFCAGGTTLHATTGAGYSWQWYSGSTPITGATTANYYVTATGTYKVKVANASGCASMSVSDSVTDILLPYIIAGDTTSFCTGGSVMLTINTAGMAISVYQWKRNSINIPGATNGSYTATTAGNYTCFENIDGGCIATTPVTTVTVIDCSLAVASGQLAIGSLRVYPNPATDELNVADVMELMSYRLVNVAGQNLQQGSLQKGSNTFSLKNYAPGIYLLEVTGCDGFRSVFRVVKE